MPDYQQRASFSSVAFSISRNDIIREMAIKIIQSMQMCDIEELFTVDVIEDGALPKVFVDVYIKVL